MFRFFPIRVSSIAAISLDAIVGTTYVAFKSKASGSLVVPRQTIALIISENTTHAHFKPGPHRSICIQGAWNLISAIVNRNQVLLGILLGQMATLQNFIDQHSSSVVDLEIFSDSKSVIEKVGTKWYLTFWVGYPGYTCRLAHCRCQCYTDPHRLPLLKCQKYIGRKVKYWHSQFVLWSSMQKCDFQFKAGFHRGWNIYFTWKPQ